MKEGQIKMKRHLLIMLSILLAFVATNAAADTQVVFAEGECWNHLMSEEAKGWYLLAYQLGVATGLTRAMPGAKEADLDKLFASIYPAPMTALHSAAMRKSLDKFYSDYKNINIPIYLAIDIISMELRGVSKEKIDSLLRTYRKATPLQNLQALRDLGLGSSHEKENKEKKIPATRNR